MSILSFLNCRMVLCLLSLWLLISPNAKAMTVEPMVIEVNSIGSNVKSAFKVSNNGTAPLPVEVNISRMEIGADGTLKYASGGDDFIVFPPQAAIPKGGAQIFRLQWIGNPEIQQSQNYRFSVAQIPVKQKSGASGIQITMSFGVVVSVSPPQGSAAIVAKNASFAKDNEGKSAIALHVANPGNKHAYMRDAAIKFRAGSWSQKLTAYEVGQKVGLGIVQPGKERRFVIPVDVPPGVSDITASIDYKPEN